MNAFFSRFARPGLLALCFLLLLLPSPAVLHAAGQPVTVKELCLMLRGGYTGDEVLRETAGRPLLEPIDADAEKALRAAGADARLIATLKTTHPALTDDQAAAARAHQAEIDQRNLEAQAASRSNTLAFHKQAAETHQNALRQGSQDKLAGQLRGLLVTLTPSGLQPYDDATLAGKKMFAIYFSALMNPQCRQFTPQLVKFYQDYAPTHPEFEIVLFSEDRSSFNMENAMRQNAMPWPALGFDHETEQPGLAALGKSALPRLVLLDGAGHLISDSFVDGQYVGPQHVLDDLMHPPAAAPNAPAPGPGAQ